MNEIKPRGWLLQPAIPGRMGPCLCCGVASDFFDPEAIIAVGFGAAALTRDGGLVWSEPQRGDPMDEGDEEEEYMTGAQAEELAATDPDHDWQIMLHGPMRSRVYQRHGPGQWALIEQGEGFA